MKRVLLIVLIALCGIANSQTYQWAKTPGGKWPPGGGTWRDWHPRVATDPQGNIIFLGLIAGSITFGDTTLIPTIDKNLRAFMVKFDKAGNVMWAKNEILKDHISCPLLLVDTIGNIIVCGDYSDSANTFGISKPSANPDAGFFIMKYDTGGKIIWTKIERKEHMSISNATIDKNGNIFIKGNYLDSITFGTTTLSDFGLTKEYMVKYDGTGNLIWAKTYHRRANVVFDAKGNTIEYGTLLADTTTFGTTILTQTNSKNEDYIVKYDGSGNVLWAKEMRGVRICDLTVDVHENIIVAAISRHALDTIGFGAKLWLNSNHAHQDIFIMKCDGSGGVLWAKKSAGNSDDYVYAMTTDSNGNIIITGSYHSSIIHLGTKTLTNANAISTDMFIVKFDGSGNVVWAVGAGGIRHEAGYEVVADATGNIIVAGYFEGRSITFGTTSLKNSRDYLYNDDSYTHNQLFIVKLN